MIGFQYICNLHNVQYIEIAELLQISKQTINSWTSGRRNIPEKYLSILAKKFQIPEEYFQKELNEVDKLKIQELKINNESNTDVAFIKCNQTDLKQYIQALNSVLSKDSSNINLEVIDDLKRLLEDKLK